MTNLTNCPICETKMKSLFNSILGEYDDPECVSEDCPLYGMACTNITMRTIFNLKQENEELRMGLKAIKRNVSIKPEHECFIEDILQNSKTKIR